MIRILTFAGLILLCPLMKAQPLSDSLVSYEFATAQVDTVLPVSIDTAANRLQSSAFLGSLPTSIQTLPSQLDTSVYPNSQLLKLEKAATRFLVTDYPLRTSVKIMGFSNGDTLEACSGTLVGDKWVLTHVECFYSPTQGWQLDSIHVFPAFDNGVEQAALGRASVMKAYRFMDVDVRRQQDVGLLELSTDLGDQVGYMGLYVESDSQFYRQTLFHKLCYVAQALPYDSLFAYTNDTLYYTHGLLQFPFSSAAQLGTRRVAGLAGQLGSPFFFQDSSQGNHAFLVGGANYASGYQHFRITSETFFPLVALIGSPLANMPDLIPVDEWNFRVFPNPTGEQATILLDPFPEPLNLILWTLQGERVRTWQGILDTEVMLERENIAVGVYMLEVRAGERRLGIQKIRFQ